MAEVVPIEDTVENHDILKHAKPGDMIQFTRGLYSHWAIYVGDGFVVHRWGDHDGIGRSVGFLGNLLTFSGTQFDKATILQSKISDVMRLGGDVKINNYLDHKCKPLPVEVILDKARRALNKEGYNLMYSNCEHFATECRYGQANSRQVQMAVGASAVVTGAIVGGAVAAAALLLGSSPEKDDVKKPLKDIPTKT